MRRPIAFSFAAAVLLLVLDVPAWADQKTLVYTTKMSPPIHRTAGAAEDKPGHEVVTTVRRDMTSSDDADWNGVPVIVYGTTDYSGDTATVSGFAIRTHRNGDQTYYTYRGKLQNAGQRDPQKTVGNGTVELVGGTGKFANAKGSGSWRSEKGQSRIEMQLTY